MTEVMQSFAAEELVAGCSGYSGGILELLLLEIRELHNELKQANEKIDYLTAHSKQIEIKVDMANTGIQTVNDKIDTAFEMLRCGFKEIKEDIKEKNLKIEDILSDMASKLRNFEGSVKVEDVMAMFENVKIDYRNWDAYDSTTQTYIPISEYLYSKFHEMKNKESLDYSPVIIEFCCAIENEYLRKIFEKYVSDLSIRKPSYKLKEFLKNENIRNKNEYSWKRKTDKFITAIEKAVSYNNYHQFTLGTMHAILRMLTDRELVLESQLLADFKNYLGSRTNYLNLLDSNHITNLNTIVTEYRNPSAHPEIMGEETAKKCKEVIPVALDHLIDCLQPGNKNN